MSVSVPMERRASHEHKQEEGNKKGKNNEGLLEEEEELLFSLNFPCVSLLFSSLSFSTLNNCS